MNKKMTAHPGKGIRKQVVIAGGVQTGTATMEDRMEVLLETKN